MTDDEISARAERYIVDRLDPQLKWYEDKASAAKTAHHRFAGLQIAATAVVPVLNSFAHDLFAMTYAASIAACIAAVAGGFAGFRRNEENWLRYRQTASALQALKVVYAHRGPPFQGDDRDDMLITQTEQILENESRQWTSDHAVSGNKK